MAREMICSNCGFTGNPKKKVRGSIFIELILWLALIVPGLVYSIWRLTTKQSACPKCGALYMIPLDSPRGKKLAVEFGGK